MQQVLISNSLLEVFVGAAYQGKMFRVSIMFYVPYGSIQPIPVQPVYLHELFFVSTIVYCHKPCKNTTQLTLINNYKANVLFPQA